MATRRYMGYEVVTYMLVENDSEARWESSDTCEYHNKKEALKWAKKWSSEGNCRVEVSKVHYRINDMGDIDYDDFTEVAIFENGKHI